MEMNEFIELIKESSNLIYNHEIFYSLKSYGVRRIRKEQINVLKVCLILDYIGLPITISFIDSVLGFKHDTSNMILARMGSKNIVLLVGYGYRGCLIYKLISTFRDKYIRIDYSLFDDLKKKLEVELDGNDND